MSAESWKICLSYQDENQQHQVFELFINKDNISFYELVLLIEEVGYSPAYDFLYYKKKYPCGKGYLVRIDNDVHVNKMISEHTNEKRIQLYVFREEANIDVAPSDAQHEVDGPAIRLEDVFDEGAVKTKTTTSQRTVRRSKRLNVVQSHIEYIDGECDPVLETHALEDNGNQLDIRDDRVDNISGVGKRRGTSLPAVWNMPNGERIVVKCNNLGQPIGDEGGVLGKFLGTIARLGGYCPLDKKDWRNVKKDGGAETILQCVQTKFLYPTKCDKWILKTTGRDWRRFKAGLKEKFFSANKKRKSLYKLCPEYVDSDQWCELVRFWKSREARAVSDKNKTSRSMVKTSHTAGTKSFARWAEDLVELENIITEHPELAQSEHGRVAWKGDALHKVLGNEKPGQVHGMGLLPVPNQVYGRKSRYLKNINVTTIDGSSHDGGADAMEEIAKLKQLIEQQDKIIDALRNNDGFRGANEITMVGTQVILKSSTYPNKRHVAHATILSCKSKQLVGGVELGRQFIEVQVDQPIDECELLIERFSG
ncbi:hypothetical protein D1007_34599 [Hordeum vulgare]|nr:hypothetical protein D1007_34599 [Hordeum vulgare]